ncbi:hypothetical protein Tco_0035047, partial [Tanacetum coccineum]
DRMRHAFAAFVAVSVAVLRFQYDALLMPA